MSCKDANAAPRSLDVSARVGFDPKVGGGFEVSFSELTVKGDVPGISAEDFQAAVQQASEGCPISQALKGNVEITAEAQVGLTLYNGTSQRVMLEANPNAPCRSGCITGRDDSILS